MKTLKFTLLPYALLALFTCAFAMTEDEKREIAIPLIVGFQKAPYFEHYAAQEGTFASDDLDYRLHIGATLYGSIVEFIGDENHVLGSLTFDNEIVDVKVNDQLVELVIASPRFFETVTIDVLRNTQSLSEKQRAFIYALMPRIFQTAALHSEESTILVLDEAMIFDSLPRMLQNQLAPYVSKRELPWTSLRKSTGGI